MLFEKKMFNWGVFYKIYARLKLVILQLTPPFLIFIEKKKATKTLNLTVDKK